MHGSSNKDSANEEIKKFFGEVEFDPSGMVKKEEGEEEGEEQGRAEGEEEGGAGEQGTTGAMACDTAMLSVMHFSSSLHTYR